MDILGLQNAVNKLQQTADEQQQKIATLESQVAKDVNQIADKVIAAVMPEVEKLRQSFDSLILVVDASVTEALGVVRRINGASVTVKLGAE